ncbi:gliding motility-associated C-terminal domain-containing protein [Sediminibacterium goheungense]|nr:gliding motility-associated C-terminal domain-containing protein [Sediminibacterium goheungense]
MASNNGSPLAAGGSQEMILYFTSDKDASVTVEIPALNYTQQYTVTKGQVTVSNPIPKTGAQDARIADTGYFNRGIHITSTQDIVAYAHIYNASISGASLLFPTNTLGKEYYAISYNQFSNQAFSNSFFFVVATEDNTVVEITPSAQNRNNKPVNTPFTVTLNKGQIYSVMGTTSGNTGTDLTGSKIRSVSVNAAGGCKKIAVFSGTGKISIGGGNSGSADNLFAQAFPFVAWGKKYLTVPTGSQPNNFYRICVADPNTVVKLNGTVIPKTQLINNFYYQFKNSSTTGTSAAAPNLIESDLPILVSQYCTTQGVEGNSGAMPGGDPEMIYLSPVEQTINDITLYSADRNAILQSFINIVVKKGGVSSFKLDGNSISSNFLPHPADTSYYYATLSVSRGAHNLYSDTGFNAIAYGFGSAESYGYNAGTNVKDFSRQATFANPYGRIDSAVTCVNTPVKFSVPLSFQPTTVRWDFSAAPNISPNTTINFNTSPTADSTPVVSGQTLYYFSPGTSFLFSASNTTVLRDTVKLYTTSSTPDGCGSTDQVYSIPIKVVAKPTTDFSVATTGCVGENVVLSPSTGSGVQYFWDTGDGKTFNFNQPNETFTYNYSQSGSYTVKLKAVSDIGCITEEVIKTVAITTKPIASFTYSAIRCLNSDITFTDASTTQSGTLAKWTWNLDDGTGETIATSNAARITKYASTGTKNVSLQVETSTGCKSEIFTPATALVVNPLPQPGFILPEVCLNDASAQFTDTSKIADGSEAQFSYLWNFNAGTPAITPGPNISSSTLKNPQVKYNKSDNYTVSLRVTSKDGCINTTSQSFTVNGSIPKADFEVQMNNVLCDKVPIVILNKSTVDFGSVTKSEIYWDRVNAPAQVQTDEFPANDKAYPHKYTVNNAAGQNFTIRMVSYSGGNTCVSEVSKTITVHPNPKAAYSISSATVCYDEPVSFTDQSALASIAVPTRWVWDLGKGNSSTIQNPVRAYRDSGIFNTSLHVFSAAGCGSDTAAISFTVYPLPVLVMGTKSTAVLEGGEIKLKPSFVYGNQLSYLWSPSSYLSSDTAYSPISKPLNDIRYTFNVIAEGGCTVSDTIFVKVLKSPEIPNAFSPNGDGINDTWNIKYLESYPGATVEVYNRYGQIVYRSLGYSKPWDGRVSGGNLLPIGTYYYIINPKNNKPQMTGSITIIR